MIVSGAVITNGNTRNTDLIIENNVPVLRQKDILKEQDAQSICGQIYFVIQLMYIDNENLTAYQNRYWKIVRELLVAAPQLTGPIDQINEHILSADYYQALKLAGELIHYEEEILKNADAGTQGV